MFKMTESISFKFKVDQKFYNKGQKLEFLECLNIPDLKFLKIFKEKRDKRNNI